jgi:hypothetical protein
VAHQTLRDEHQNRAGSLPPMSLARRCDHIIDLIDELLTVPALRADTADGRTERHRWESPRTVPDARERGVRTGDVAS